MTTLHRRNPSHDDDEDPAPLPQSAGPHQGTFAHSRTRSTSTPYPPPQHSPLTFSFPSPLNSPRATTLSNPGPSPQQSRRHSRIHSRNLSVFFPRPGSLPATVAEDGSQEIEVKDVESTYTPNTAPVRSPPTPLGVGFTFGGRPDRPVPPLMTRDGTSSSSRRGHHHKHSLSHNFFSFLEPGTSSTGLVDLHTQPTPALVSPWNHSHQISPQLQNNHHFENEEKPATDSPPLLNALCILQFLLGSWLWVSGQKTGSIATTGLGYWIVFDSFGIFLTNPSRLLILTKKRFGIEDVRYPYGNGRRHTVLLFAQSVYLMFSAIYVCKETVEHLLLSAGGVELQHHHVVEDEDTTLTVALPVFQITIALLSLIISGISFNNHSKLVNTIGNRIALVKRLRTLWWPGTETRSESSVLTLLSNPYTTGPICFSLGLLAIAIFIPEAQRHKADLVLASVITGVTLRLAYQATTVLGTVLLQTSPRRGVPGGRMEAFLRTMRELERHPQILHLPAPHLWQVAPVKTVSDIRSEYAGCMLVATMELHVKKDLGDDELISLTRWAWERCTWALGGGKDSNNSVEVTIGIVRG